MDLLTYNLFHLIAVFYVPAAVIVISYTIVVLHMFNLSAKRKTSARRMAKAGFNGTGEDGITQVSNLTTFGLELASFRGERENLNW